MPKTYIVTGASGGIGFELAKKISETHKVVAISRSEGELAKITSKNISFYSVDISSKDEVEKLCNELSETGVILDGIVNNAGLLINKPFLEQSEEDWYNSYNVNVFGIVRLLKSLLPRFKDGAHVVNISSMGGFQGSSKYPGLSSYASSKGALSILTECLASEIEHLKFNCLCLGAVQTEMLSKAFPGYEAPVQPSEMAEFIAGFLQTGHFVYNGKILPVALSNP